MVRLVIVQWFYGDFSIDTHRIYVKRGGGSIHVTGYAGSRDYVVTLQSPQKTPHIPLKNRLQPSRKSSLRVTCYSKSSQPAHDSSKRVRVCFSVWCMDRCGVFCGDCRVPKLSRDPAYPVMCFVKQPDRNSFWGDFVLESGNTTFRDEVQIFKFKYIWIYWRIYYNRCFSYTKSKMLSSSLKAIQTTPAQELFRSACITLYVDYLCTTLKIYDCHVL